MYIIGDEIIVAYTPVRSSRRFQNCTEKRSYDKSYVSSHWIISPSWSRVILTSMVSIISSFHMVPFIIRRHWPRIAISIILAGIQSLWIMCGHVSHGALTSPIIDSYLNRFSSPLLECSLQFLVSSQVDESVLAASLDQLIRLEHALLQSLFIFFQLKFIVERLHFKKITTNSGGAPRKHLVFHSHRKLHNAGSK